MAVRPRRQRRSAAPWTPAIHLALTIGPPPQPSDAVPRPSDEVLEAAWGAYGPYLLAGVEDPSTVWGFRRFEGSGAERPRMYPAPPLPLVPYPKEC